jgi:hypothetical protein
MSDSADEIAAEPPAPAALPPPQAARRRVGAPVLIAVLAGAIFIVAIAAAPFWAPAVMQSVPWGTQATKPVAAAPDPALAEAKTEADSNAAALQQLAQRVAALEARPAPAPTDLAPTQQRLAELDKTAADLAQRIAALEARPVPAPPDLSSIEQRLGALDKTAGDLTQRVAVLDQSQAARPAIDPSYTALALVLAEIREAIDIGRPFATEYGQLVALAHNHPDIAAAAEPLAGPAQNGVASRAVLAERLRELAPQIATAKPPPKQTWKAQIVAQLRSLVTIRRIAGESQTPAEAAVGAAQQAMASGDLAGAIAPLDGLGGVNQAAAQPWLQMAKERLAVEAALRQVQATLVTALGNAAPSGSGASEPGKGG